MSQEEATPGPAPIPAKPISKEWMKTLGLGEPQGQEPKVVPDLTVTSQTPPETPPSAPKSEDDEQKKADAEGQKVIDNYSAQIQEEAESLYGTMLLRAQTEEGYLQKLVTSTDKTKRKFAEKILSRNPELFGAGSVEEYKKNLAISSAGDDPIAQKVAAIEVQTQELSNKQQLAEWETWKKEAQITGDLASLVDDLHSQYPLVSRGDIIAMAKGRLGGNGPAITKKASSAVPGGSSISSSDDPYASPLARRFLKNPADVKKFAERLERGEIL
jgi:hypothetical protein